MKLFNWRRSRGGTYRVRVLCWNCDGYVQVRVAQGTPMGGAVVACPKCGVSGTLATGSIWLSAGENAKAPPPEPKHPIPSALAADIVIPEMKGSPRMFESDRAAIQWALAELARIGAVLEPAA